MKIKNAAQLLEAYPKLELEGYNDLYDMCGDLHAISETGKIIAITEADICVTKNGFHLEVKKFILIDSGVEADK